MKFRLSESERLPRFIDIIKFLYKKVKFFMPGPYIENIPKPKAIKSVAT